MQSSPLVSVVTVCYNLIKNGRADFFKQCAESVHQQNYSHIEHLVIDGGSQDGTVELLETYAQKGWLRYLSEPDKGIYDAMNKGIREAQGKYVAFLNSDDFWHHPDGVAASVAALESHGAAFSYAPRNMVKENGDFLYRENTGIGTFAEHMPFCHQTMFTRKEVLQAHHGFDDKKYRSAADYDLIMRIILSGESCVYVPLNFTSFRRGGFSAMESAVDMPSTEMYLVRKNLLGEDAANMLSRGYMDDSLMQHILSKVHGSVALDVLRCHRMESAGIYSLTYGLSHSRAQGKLSAGYRIRKIFSCKLFALLPMLTIRQRKGRTDYLLFGVLPIVTVRKKHETSNVCLFGILPIFSVSARIAG